MVRDKHSKHLFSSASFKRIFIISFYPRQKLPTMHQAEHTSPNSFRNLLVGSPAAVGGARVLALLKDLRVGNWCPTKNQESSSGVQGLGTFRPLGMSFIKFGHAYRVASDIHNTITCKVRIVTKNEKMCQSDPILWRSSHLHNVFNDRDVFTFISSLSLNDVDFVLFVCQQTYIIHLLLY